MNYKDYLIKHLKKFKRDEDVKIDPHAELRAPELKLGVNKWLNLIKLSKI